jgi:hypothetical protein
VIATAGPVAGLPESIERSTASVAVGGLPAGRYRLRLDPHPSALARTGSLSVSVSAGGTDFGQALLFIGLLLLLPLLLSVAAVVVEGQRWSQSDHAE